MNVFRRVKTVLCLLSAAILLTAASGCGSNANAQEQTVSYSELDSDGQAVVDIVYNSYDAWASVHDSGQDFYCTNIGFFSVGGNLIFAGYYSTAEDDTGRTEGGTSVIGKYGFYGASIVNRETGALEGYDGSTDYFLSLSLTAQVWDANADADTQKDIIANEYAAFLESEED